MRVPYRKTFLVFCASILLYVLYVQLVSPPWYQVLSATLIFSLGLFYLESPRSKVKQTEAVKAGGQTKSGTKDKKAKEIATEKNDISLPEETEAVAVCELYVSEKEGSDQDGDGSEQSPFKTTLKALFVAKDTAPTIYVDSQKAGERWAMISKNQMKNAKKAWNRQQLMTAAKDKKEDEDNSESRENDLQEAKEVAIETEPEPNTVKIESMVTGFQARLSATESLAGDNFTKMAAAERTIKYLQEQNTTKLANKTNYFQEQTAAKLASAEQTIKYLQEQNANMKKYLQEQNANMKKYLQEQNDRVDELENRSRRSNLMLVNVPEDSENGQSTNRFVSNLLMDIMGKEVFDKPPELDRAHRSICQKPKAGQPPRPFVVAFHWLQEKEKALRWGLTHEMRYKGCKMRVYPDLCVGTAKKRAAFKPVKQLLYERGIQFKLLYPAQLRVNYRNDTFTFLTPEEAQKFCDNLSDISTSRKQADELMLRNFNFVNNPHSGFFN